MKGRGKRRLFLIPLHCVLFPLAVLFCFSFFYLVSTFLLPPTLGRLAGLEPMMVELEALLPPGAIPGGRSRGSGCLGRRWPH